MKKLVKTIKLNPNQATNLAVALTDAIADNQKYADMVTSDIKDFFLERVRVYKELYKLIDDANFEFIEDGE
jgi:hypothetical protein